MMLTFGKTKKQNGSKIGKKLRNETVRNFTLFLIKRECVYQAAMYQQKFHPIKKAKEPCNTINF